MLYVSPDFATSFIEAVVRDRFVQRRRREIMLKEVTERAWASIATKPGVRLKNFFEDFRTGQQEEMPVIPFDSPDIQALAGRGIQRGPHGADVRSRPYHQVVSRQPVRLRYSLTSTEWFR